MTFYGLRGNYLKWIKSFLEYRTQFVEINGYKSKMKIIKCGVPQGSTLGPLLFLLFINDLFTVFNNGIVFNFADDTSILFCGKTFDSLQKLINSETEILADWLKANELSINESKTKVLVFRPSSIKTPDTFHIKINNCKIFCSKKVTYVGVQIDEHLSWKEHIDSLCIKLSQCVGILSKLRYYASTETCLSVYFALFHSYLTYSCLVWKFANKCYLEKIRILQRQAIRMISFSKP